MTLDDLAIGTVTTRAQNKERYGGATYGGIEPSNTTPTVLVYTDPAQGRLSGYNYDGWDKDDDDVFYYTGEGASGDQKMTDGNKALLDHAIDGRVIRLWEAVVEKRRPGGKRHRYLGAFEIDAANPYRIERADRKSVV